MHKKFLNFNIPEINQSIFHIIKNTNSNTHHQIITKFINIFNNTILQTILLLFHMSHSTKKKQKPNKIVEESVMPLSEYIEKLKRTIESSKVFIKSIVDNIRYKGKIKIVNTANNNPTHPQNISTFPDLTTFTKTSRTQDDYFPDSRFDEKFDLEGRKKILNMDKNFKKRMDASIQKSYYYDFLNKDKWEVLDRLNSLDNINFTIKKFQEKYTYLKLFDKLEESFMMDSNPFLFIINDHIIPIDTHKKMMESFEKIIPNIETRRLISVYANKKFLRQAYLQILSEHPDISEYQLKNIKNTYNINYLNDGSIKLVATHVSNLDVKNDNYIKKYNSFGIRATVIFNANNSPIVKYSYFLK